MLSSTRTSVARKRPYSKDFTPKDTETFKRYLLDRIPIGFWIRVEAKAKREHKSIRQLILELLKDWLGT
jgi:hypothetical protein